MRIGIVGGLDRSGPELERAARKAGHQVEFHTGKLQGPSSGALESLIDRSDVVVFVTGINSHAALHRTKDYMRRSGREAVFVRNAGISAFRRVLADLSTRKSAAGRRVS